MPHPAWDIMIDDDTYQLLQDYYGSRVDLYTVVSNMDRESIIRLLDDIIETCEEFPDEDLLSRAKAAKRRVGGS